MASWTERTPPPGAGTWGARSGAGGANWGRRISTPNEWMAGLTLNRWSAGTLTALTNYGVGTRANGTNSTTGTVWAIGSISGYPYVQQDTLRNLLVMHPNTSPADACVTYTASADGLYVFTGSFCRGNTALSAGDGVIANIYQNASTTPVWTATIASSHAVSGLPPFTGTSNSPFELSYTLTAGETLHFVVNANTGGSGFDGTYFRMQAAAWIVDDASHTPETWTARYTG